MIETEIETEIGSTTVMIAVAVLGHAVEVEVQSANAIGKEFVSGILWIGKGTVSVTIATSIADENRSLLISHAD